jgi:type I restriction enzyme M protein
MFLENPSHEDKKNIDTLPLKSHLRPVPNLKSVFENCHNYIYANEGLRKEQIFNEVLKLIFLKMVDEQTDCSTCQFGITFAERKLLERGDSRGFLERFNKLLETAKVRFGNVFSQNDKIDLNPLTLAFLILQFQEYSLSKTPIDVKGTAFQTFVYAHARGERGEFFTPYPVVKLCVGMLDPKDSESVIDPACGSGAFLTETIKYCWNAIESSGNDLPSEKKKELMVKYAKTRIRGIDFNPDLAKVAKMHMILLEDGHTGILSTNSLYPFESIKAIAKEAANEGLEPESFDVVMTNPPFGTRGKVTDKRILEQFELGHRWEWDDTDRKWYATKELLTGQIPEILFLERCLQFLKNHGRMAIVLPDGELTNQSSQYVRQFIQNYTRIIGVVSLPQETFIPYGTSTKASVLFTQKLAQDELKGLKDHDYPIFMATCEKIGYDVRGNTLSKKDEKGRLIDPDGNFVPKREQAAVDTDIEDIIESFKLHRKANTLGF